MKNIIKYIFITLFTVLSTNKVLAQNIYIAETGVRGTGIFFRGFVNSDINTSDIIVERSSSLDGPYFTLSKIKKPANSYGVFTYIDYLANVNSDIFYYRLVAIDSLGNIDTISNSMSNIRVDVETKTHEQNWVKWNKPVGFNGEIDRYVLYRSIGDNSMRIIDDNIAPNDTIYVDRIGNITDAKICYQVRAIEKNNTLEISESFKPFVSRSNIQCEVQEPKINLPNAFKPLSSISENTTFGVKNRFIRSNNFNFTIWDRWGNIVFQTNNPNDEWDGYVNDNLVPMGTYIYTLRYQSVDGKVNDDKGMVTVIY